MLHRAYPHDRRRTFFRRLKRILSEGAARQNAINASLAQGVEASLRWLTELTTSLATTNYAITRVNDRVSSLVSDTTMLAHYSADTREQLLTTADQVHQKLNHLEENSTVLTSSAGTVTS